MKQKQLQKKYSELIESGNTAKGRKDTVSFYHKAAKNRSKIYKKSPELLGCGASIGLSCPKIWGVASIFSNCVCSFP